MAPLPPSTKAPSARSLRMQRISGQIHPLLPAKIFRTDAHVTDDFINSKRDKRVMKHSSFVSRITSSKITKNKRRRPNNKLKTSLEGLADALPELRSGEGGEEVLAGKVKHKSLKSKRGALRRKERVVRGEMERFGVSMAKLSGMQGSSTAGNNRQGVGEEDSDADSDGDDTMTTQSPAAPVGGAQQSTGAGQAAGTSDRWAALRGYISSTMEQNPAFAGK